MLCVTFIVIVLSWEVLPPILSVVIFFVILLYRQMFYFLKSQKLS